MLDVLKLTIPALIKSRAWLRSFLIITMCVGLSTFYSAVNIQTGLSSDDILLGLCLVFVLAGSIPYLISNLQKYRIFVTYLGLGLVLTLLVVYTQYYPSFWLLSLAFGVLLGLRDTYGVYVTSSFRRLSEDIEIDFRVILSSAMLLAVLLPALMMPVAGILLDNAPPILWFIIVGIVFSLVWLVKERCENADDVLVS
ncbi:hypothetical protein AB6D11_00425 [Vibrio splendidus]